MRKFRALGVLTALCFNFSNAHGTDVTLTFDDLSPTWQTNNLNYGGLRFSPCDYYSINTADEGFQPNDSNWFGFGGMGALGNALQIGGSGLCENSAIASGLLIDHQGTPFTLESFTGVFGFNGPIFDVLSSNGGHFRTFEPGSYHDIPPVTIFTFSGKEWTDILWLKFIANPDPTIGFDNLRVSYIPEPNALELLVLGTVLAGALGWSLRSRHVALYDTTLQDLSAGGSRASFEKLN